METNDNCISLDSWADIGQADIRQMICEQVLIHYLPRQRWFAGKSKEITKVHIAMHALIETNWLPSHLWLVSVSYSDATNEWYLLPVCLLTDRDLGDSQVQKICEVRIGIAHGWLCDATWCIDFRMSLLRHFIRQARVTTTSGEQLLFSTSMAFPAQARDIETTRVLKAEQSNTSIIFGQNLFFKLYRKIEPGINPEIVLSRYLSEQAGFTETPPWLGDMSWKTNEGVVSIGILQTFLPDSQSCWDFLLSRIDHDTSKPEYLQNEVSRLAGLTARMHDALALSSDDDLSTEPVTSEYLAEFTSELRRTATDAFDLLESKLEELPPTIRPASEHLLALEEEVATIINQLNVASVDGQLIRVHSDYHLGQILVQGECLWITDFEGEPGRSLVDRRKKHSPLKDVAGMLRSFHYCLYAHSLKGQETPDVFALETLYQKMTDNFLQAYSAGLKEGILPEDYRTILRLFILDKALYELRYELNNRPEWTLIPVLGVTSAIKEWLESGIPHV